ncbi:MAG: hypothetical protein ACLPLZ_13295 [Terracidiphilus sp.]
MRSVTEDADAEVIDSPPHGGSMIMSARNHRGISFYCSLFACAIGLLPFWGAQASRSQSSLESDVDNARVIEMTHKGLGNDVIIARIKASATRFDLSDDDLANLKRQGVSDAVVAAMIQSTQLTVAKVTIDGNPVEVRTIGEQKVGGRLGHDLTAGIMSVKNKAYLQGQHASVIASRNAVIQIELPANDNIDNYIIVEMDDKGDRREIEMGSVGGTVGEKVGIRADRIVRVSTTPIGGRRFKVTPVKELKKGEYILYSVGSADFPHGVYGQGFDFTVQ